MSLSHARFPVFERAVNISLLQKRRVASYSLIPVAVTGDCAWKHFSYCLEFKFFFANEYLFIYLSIF